MAYGFTRSITIDKTKVPNTNQTDFPVLIKGTYAYLATTGNGGDVQNANGYDIGFFADQALTTPLDWETRVWIDTTGEVVYWVRVPTVSTSVDTVIYLAYGDATISTDQSNTTGTWNANYMGVMHLGENTNANIIDITSNANVGTVNGFPLTATVTSPIDLGTDFGVGAGSGTNGNDIADFGPNNSLNINGQFTYKCLFYQNNYPSAFQQNALMAKAFYLGTPLFTPPFAKTELYSGEFGGDLIVGYNGDDGTTSYTVDYNLGSSALNTWFWVGVTNDGSDSVIYVNGQPVASVTDPVGALPTTAVGAFISGYDFGGLGTVDRLNGAMAESCWLNVPLSADWFATEYNNQSSPSTFYTISAPLSDNNSGMFFRFF